LSVSYKHIITQCVGLLLLPILFFACTSAPKREVKAKKGSIDLSKWNFEVDGATPLNGEWAFYWKKYLKGSDFEQEKEIKFVQVPNSWTTYKTVRGETPTTEGYATYRLTVKIPSQFKGNELMALRLEFITTNYALFVQNKLMNHPRKLGTSPETTDGHYNPEIYFFIPQSDSVEIVLHVANYAYRLGGLTQKISLGKAQTMSAEYERTLMICFFSIGILIIMGFSHLILYFYRSKSLSVLYFAFYCFIIALRILVTDDYYFSDLFPNANFEIGNKIAYLTFSIGMTTLTIFVHSLYPRDFSVYVLRATGLFSVIFSLIVIFTKGIFYSNYLIYYQLYAFLVILYSIYFVVRILVKRRSGSIIFAFGMTTILFTATNDILLANLVVQTMNLMPIGSFIFIFSQTLILSKNFAIAFAQIETMSQRLKFSNQELETTVRERTMQLNDVHEGLAQNLEELKSNGEIINIQHKEIRTQYSNIMASINYAKNIQNNILPDTALITKHFPHHFIIFDPKDIVSGDFYYFYEKGNKLILAAVDCTGHGVPGAFMSLIGYKILNQVVENQNITEPADILMGLHSGIRRLLKQEISASRDGMDVALVVIDKAKRELKFAGVKNPLVYVENGKIEVIKGNNSYIGGSYSKEGITFSQTVIPLPKEDGKFNFYLFSDGYQDQFGGEGNQKLMKGHFRELIFQVQDMPMHAQGKALSEWHELWKGDKPQTDDILVMGFCI
jgi:serine phosphatase RsbU (regulator of sigma subunit)